MALEKSHIKPVMLDDVPTDFSVDGDFERITEELPVKVTGVIVSCTHVLL